MNIYKNKFNKSAVGAMKNYLFLYQFVFLINNIYSFVTNLKREYSKYYY